MNCKRKRFRRDLDFREATYVGAQDIPLKDKIGELAFTDDLNQASGFELFKMVGEGRGADRVKLVQFCAGRWTRTGAKLLENLNTTWLSENARDASKLTVREFRLLRSGHAIQPTSIG